MNFFTQCYLQDTTLNIMVDSQNFHFSTQKLTIQLGKRDISIHKRLLKYKAYKKTTNAY